MGLIGDGTTSERSCLNRRSFTLALAILSVFFTSMPSASVVAFVPGHKQCSRSAFHAATSDDAASAVEAPPANSGATDDVTLKVALTRETGKNTKLEGAIASQPLVTMMGLNVDLVEQPCVEHASGPDHDELLELISSDRLKEYQYVVITSPEAARVFCEAMGSVSRDNDNISGTKIAAVGKATKKSLEEKGLAVDFVPTKANGETLAEELPPASDSSPTKVLYPASAKAAETIKENLEARGEGFKVTRLNTYDTVPSTFSSEQLAKIEEIDVACFGSPSAVNAWLENVDRMLGVEDLDEEERRKMGNGNVVAACIGSTTARECLNSGRWEARHIYYPKQNPGMDGWAESTATALADVNERKFWGGGW